LGSLANGLYTSSGRPAAGASGRSGDLRSEFDLIEAGFYRARRSTVQVHFEDANTAASRSVVLPYVRGGTVKRISVVPSANNATAATVFTAAIDGNAITMPALEIASGGLAHAAVSVVPSAANTYEVDAVSVLTITSNGGGSGVMPVSVTVEIED
jgi:hypothetical protein